MNGDLIHWLVKPVGSRVGAEIRVPWSPNHFLTSVEQKVPVRTQIKCFRRSRRPCLPFTISSFPGFLNESCFVLASSIFAHIFPCICLFGFALCLSHLNRPCPPFPKWTRVHELSDLERHDVVLSVARLLVSQQRVILNINLTFIYVLCVNSFASLLMRLYRSHRHLTAWRVPGLIPSFGKFCVGDPKGMQVRLIRDT